MAAIIVIGAGIAVTTILGAWPDKDEVARAAHPQKYTEEVEFWAAEYGLDPLLVYTFIYTESSFRPDAESSAGARGLMQMTSDTFDWVKSKIAPDEELVFDDLFTPGTSIRFGAYYLAISLERYGGDVSTAAAAYHSGWGTVDGLLDDGRAVLETFPYKNMQHYVNKINNNYQKYREIYSGDASGLKGQSDGKAED